MRDMSDITNLTTEEERVVDEILKQWLECNSVCDLAVPKERKREGLEKADRYMDILPGAEYVLTQTLNYIFSTYDSHSELHNALRLVRSFNKAKWGYFLRAESFYNVATAEEYYSKIPGCKKPPQEFHRKSHGESFLKVVQDSFYPKGMYILDEPEAALSPQRQLTLMLEMSRCVKNDSQFIIVTHSPILLGFPGAEILSFDDGKIHRVEYEETQSYQITKMFISDRRQILRHLLEE